MGLHNATTSENVYRSYGLEICLLKIISDHWILYSRPSFYEII